VSIFDTGSSSRKRYFSLVPARESDDNRALRMGRFVDQPLARTRGLVRVVLCLFALLIATAAGAQTKDAPDLPTIPDTLPDLSAHEGKSVAAVRARIDGLIWTTTPELRTPKIGAPFSLAAVRAELLRLLEGGGFATGALEVNAVAGGVEVIYRLVPARYVRRVTLKGNELGDDEVRRAGGLVDIRDVTEKSLETASQKIRAYYVLRGFPKARVEVATIETDVPLVVVVQVTIDAGVPVLVERRVFAGLPTFDAGAVTSGMAYGVRAEDRADEEMLEGADRDLTNRLRAGGFPSAVVTHSVAPGSAGNVVLTVNVVPGSRVVPDFEGHTVFDRDRLLEILDLKGEADRSPLRLASKIEAAYRRRGYYDVLVEPELLGKPSDQQRTLRFRIREGDIVTVDKREYPCLGGALSHDRIEEEIESFLDEELAGEGLGDGDHHLIDTQMGKSGDVALGARPRPNVPDSTAIFYAETYERAREHLIEVFRSEGYMFVEIGDLGILRGGCAKGSMPGAAGCKPIAPVGLDQKKLCLFDANQLPLPVPPIEKKHACIADPLKGIECAPSLSVVLPINPGPRSYLWDVAIDGTHAIPPATLMGPKVAGASLRMGDPLSLRDAEAARKAIVEYYRDEGYYFINVRVTFEYSPDKSRARLRFLVSEGEQVVIDKIYIEGEKLTLESLIQARLLIKEGGIYRAKLVRESQERLAKLGVFQSVSIGLINPTIPAKRKSVVVSVRERPQQHLEYRGGYSTGEGARFYGEYGIANILGYAMSFDIRIRGSYQPFLGASCGPRDGDPCGGGGIYDSTVVRRWVQQTEGLSRIPRRISLGLSLPHTPVLGADVRTTVEAINVLDLRRDFVGNKLILPAITMTYTPWQPLTMSFGTGLEFNNFKVFDDEDVNVVVASNPALASLLRVPVGDTGVVAFNVGSVFDFRDNRLGATRNGYVSLNLEYVRSFRDALDKRGDKDPANDQAVRSDFLHMVGGGGVYYQAKFLPKKPVFAFELRGGGNFNVLSCSGTENTKEAAQKPGVTSYCDTYPDRLFYLGGFDTTRGFFPGTMLPQDSIDVLLECGADPVCSEEKSFKGKDLGTLAARGGNVFINPRFEVRVPAFKWGGFVIFVDAANTWRNKANFQPWVLRYSVGPGLSIDTPVGPVAIDFGFNLSRYQQFGEPPVVFNFSIGRF